MTSIPFPARTGPDVQLFFNVRTGELCAVGMRRTGTRNNPKYMFYVLEHGNPQPQHTHTYTSESTVTHLRKSWAHDLKGLGYTAV